MDSTTRLNKLFVFCVLVATVGCGQPVEETSDSIVTPEPLETLNAEQSDQKDRAVAAKNKLFESLLGELTRSMGERGPAKSIAICKTRAPEIADKVSSEMGVKIGRTSLKLRNDNNRAPAWASQLVADQVENEVAVELADDGLGVLLPIRLMAACTLCHGSEHQIKPDVKAAIDSNYPNDQATGFSEGDLRGYFWIEVPAANPQRE